MILLKTSGQERKKVLSCHDALVAPEELPPDSVHKLILPPILQHISSRLQSLMVFMSKRLGFRLESNQVV
jgi:hypothetical protein